LEYLEKTGFTIVREDGRMADRFRGRVMFPIQSMSGRVLGFGGRILGNDRKVAKYLNSPESDIYHKSKVLYGIFHAKQAIAKKQLLPGRRIYRCYPDAPGGDRKRGSIERNGTYARPDTAYKQAYQKYYRTV
jgi:hypothetical protein